MKKHYIIGCGGVGSWLAPSLCLLVGRENVVLVDGDTLEKKNLNRQLFDEDKIGEFKSFLLSQKYGCESIPEWYPHTIEHNPRDWLFVCADNNPARLAALEACDRYRCQCIVAANETTSSEAYYYRPRWKGTKVDPRSYYPELVTDHSGDPMARGAGCTGEAQEMNRQLVSANFSAASLAQNLFVLWGLKSIVITRETMPMMPYRFVQNLSKQETSRIENRHNEKD